MDLIVVALVVVSISILFAYFQRKYSLNYWQSRNIPCIEPSFIHGNMENCGKKQHLAFVLSDIYNKFKGTGAKYCGVYFWSRPVAVILDLDLMKDIMIKDFNSFPDRNMYYNAKDDPLSANLATLDGDEWKKLRPKLSPTFSSGKMKYIFPLIVKVAERLNEVMKECVMKNENELNILDFILRYSADVIGTAAFGIECNSLRDANSEFIRMGRAVNSKPRHGAKSNILIHSFPNISRALGVKVLRDDVASFFMKAVKETVEYREENRVHRNDIMDILIDLKNRDSSDALTLNEIAGHAYLFFLGGFETSAIVLSCCIYELAMNPDIQTKAREEVQKVLAKNNGEFTYEMLSELTYMEQVLRETSRKYPTSASLNRFAKYDYPVPGTNHVIEKGTWIKLPRLAVHHDPDIYPEPEKFDPDRFEANEYRQRHIMSLMAFGQGPRNCIAERFAFTNMKIALTMILKDIELLKCEKTVEKITFNPKKTVLSPSKEIILKIRSIK